MNLVNPILALLLIGFVAVGIAGWHSMEWLRWAAMHLLARSEALKAAETAHSDGLRHWRTKLEVQVGNKFGVVAGGKQ